MAASIARRRLEQGHVGRGSHRTEIDAGERIGGRRLDDVLRKVDPQNRIVVDTGRRRQRTDDPHDEEAPQHGNEDIAHDEGQQAGQKGLRKIHIQTVLQIIIEFYVLFSTVVFPPPASTASAGRKRLGRSASGCPAGKYTQKLPEYFVSRPKQSVLRRFALQRFAFLRRKRIAYQPVGVLHQPTDECVGYVAAEIDVAPHPLILCHAGRTPLYRARSSAASRAST